MITVLAVDPGRDKCGLAVVTFERVLHKSIVDRDCAARAISELAAGYGAGKIVLGDGTGSTALARELEAADCSYPIEFVDEKYSSQRARSRFLSENPPRGLYRLIPRGLRAPDRPYDDYVAVILAEDYFKIQR